MKHNTSVVRERMRCVAAALLLLAVGDHARAQTLGCDSSFFTLACFEPYDTALLSTHRQRLDAIAKRILDSRRKMNPIDHVTLIGHSAYFRPTDPAEEMAQERAQNAANYLRDALARYGVSGVAIQVGNMGTREPRTSNDTQESRDLNRRVEIYLRSKANVTARLLSMQSYCSKRHRSYRVERFREQTCASEQAAARVCAKKVDPTAGEQLVGAACYPLDVTCIVCKD